MGGAARTRTSLAHGESTVLDRIPSRVLKNLSVTLLMLYSRWKIALVLLEVPLADPRALIQAVDRGKTMTAPSVRQDTSASKRTPSDAAIGTPDTDLGPRAGIGQGPK